MGGGLSSWGDIINEPRLNIAPSDKASLLSGLSGFGPISAPQTALPQPTSNGALFKRLLKLFPCLYAQINTPSTPFSIVHLCESTLGHKIISSNVAQAFEIQHPSRGPGFTYAPQQSCKSGGDVMEELCSEVLSNEGIPRMHLGSDNWPIWKMPGHISLNHGKMMSVKAFGDILIPAAPTNIIISVKSAVARERLLYSANMIEGVGFGFFEEAKEFWTKSRMNLYKRMGFTAIYMPQQTLTEIMQKLSENQLEQFAVNINGTPLYRPLNSFGNDMNRIVGKITLYL